MELFGIKAKKYPEQPVQQFVLVLFLAVFLSVMLAVLGMLTAAQVFGAALSASSPTTVNVSDNRGIEGYTKPDKTTASVEDEDGAVCEPVTNIITGIDARTDLDLQNALVNQPTDTRSDAMLIVHVTCDGKGFIFNAMRDTWMNEINCNNQASTSAAKLNAAFARGGVVCQMVMIESIIQQPIDDAIVIDFNGFRSAIDRIGGVEITVPSDTKLGKYTYAAGTHLYMGAETLNFVQNRLSNPNADWGRNQNQRDVLLSLIKKMAQLSPVEQLAIANDLKGDVAITSGLGNITDLVALFNQFKDVEWSEGYIPTPGSGWVGDQSVVFLDEVKLAEFREALKTGTLDEYFAKN